jgi:hypothetical protein
VSLFGHTCRPVDGCAVMRASVATGVPVTTATADLCRCGAVLRRELTPAGLQQVEWGADSQELLAELDTMIVRKLQLRAAR